MNSEVATTPNPLLVKLGAKEAGGNDRMSSAVGSGSRAWGFASRDSDSSARFVSPYPPNRYPR
jgi:predicted nucleotidyltransferase